MRKRNLRLDAEERDILRAFERGKLRLLPNQEQEIRKHRQYARNTLRRMAKDKRVNIRISSDDLTGIQSRALEAGIPYQTLMASVLHKYVTRQLVERG